MKGRQKSGVWRIWAEALYSEITKFNIENKESLENCQKNLAPEFLKRIEKVNKKFERLNSPKAFSLETQIIYYGDLVQYERKVADSHKWIQLFPKFIHNIKLTYARSRLIPMSALAEFVNS